MFLRVSFTAIYSLGKIGTERKEPGRRRCSSYSPGETMYPKTSFTAYGLKFEVYAHNL
jgi:hypothetical protein